MLTMITMLRLFIVATYVEQRLLPNAAGKKELYGSNTFYTIEF